MSLALLASTLEDLPYALREQVIGYAQSVKSALSSIAQDAGIPISQSVGDQVVFLAGLRKLHGIVASSYWALDNSTTLLLRSDIDRVRVGGQDYSRGSEYHQSLKSVLDNLESALLKHDVKRYLSMPYSDLVRELVGNGSQ